MVHLGPLSHMDVLPEPSPWALDHLVHLIAQTESRPGSLTDEGEQWMERQQTGKVMVVCNCGYNSGLIDHAELEDTMAGLTPEHQPAADGA